MLINYSRLPTAILELFGAAAQAFPHNLPQCVIAYAQHQLEGSLADAKTVAGYARGRRGVPFLRA